MAVTFNATDSEHLRRAIGLAELGRGRVSPNPVVGAVIVSAAGDVLGEGHHAELGGPHAERAAIADARERGNDPAGATIYVTLEPCAHTGRQPPCSEAILEAGLARVVYAADDPTEKASGRGPGILRDGDVDVIQAEGAEAAAARLQIQPFRKLARTGRPLVTYKAALSLDGRIATATGDSRWISGEASRDLVHRWRAEADAIAVGVGTALVDDPLLTARAGEGTGRQPRRVVFDSEARLPLDSQLVATIGQSPVLVICGPDAAADRVAALGDAGVEVIPVTGATRADRLGAALDELGRREVSDLFVEGGPTLAGGMFEAGAIDLLRFFIAPKVIGDGPGPFAARVADDIAEAVEPLAVDTERSGEDILITARLREY